MGKSKEDLDMEVTSGRYPPCILCKIFYTGEEEDRVKPALLEVHVDGTDVPLVFYCGIKEETSECVGDVCMSFHFLPHSWLYYSK